jgi:hypothetical protein
MNEQGGCERDPVAGTEIRWAVVVALATLLLTQVPYALSYLAVPPDLAFSGALGNYQDTNSYLAEIRQGMEGQWLFHDRYTPEDHPGGPLFLFYIGLGQAARFLGISQHTALALARPICGGILLLTLYWFVVLLLARSRTRRTAFLLLCFSSGLGWIALLYWPLLRFIGREPIDLWVAEANTFITILSVPHFQVATSLMVVVFGALLLAFRSGRWGPAWGAALACFVLSWIHPFNIAIIYAVTATYMAWQVVSQRRILWRHVGQCAPSIALSLPVLLYLQLGVIGANPVFRAWTEQGITQSPGLLPVLFGYGLLVPLAMVGVWRTLRCRAIDPLPVCWVGAVMILLNLPTNVQRRFLEGMHIPLCVLAALGWQMVANRFTGRGVTKALLRVLLVVGLLTSTLLIWGTTMTNGLTQIYPFVIHKYETDAFGWLAEHSEPQDTVLASRMSGSFIPAWAGNRVFLGHWDQTISYSEKEKAVERFLDAETAPERRRTLVEQYGVVYLFHGPNEREIGDYDPDDDPFWEPVFANDQITIYQTTLERP